LAIPAKYADTGKIGRYRKYPDAFIQIAMQICVMKYLQLLFFTLITFFSITGQLVVQVYDGDTYKIFEKGIFKIIRLANVDLPEPGQYYGTIAKSAASKLILGRMVQIDVYRHFRLLTK